MELNNYFELLKSNTNYTKVGDGKILGVHYAYANNNGKIFAVLETTGTLVITFCTSILMECNINKINFMQKLIDFSGINFNTIGFRDNLEEKWIIWMKNNKLI